MVPHHGSRRWRIASVAAVLEILLASCSTASTRIPSLSLWRLECGEFHVADIGGRPRTLSNGCYLIRHGVQFMIWDAGLDDRLVGKPQVTQAQTISLAVGLVPQLAQIGVSPSQIDRIAVSHDHGDHFGQAKHFPSARLMIAREDWAAIKADPAKSAMLETWIKGAAPIDELVGDTDVFGDGRVVILDTPGHTAGHKSLLVKLLSGPVILTGDAVHFREQLETGRPSGNHADKIAGAASIRRLLQMASSLSARIIVQHDPAEISLLPAFPAAAE